jgi:hypothetical protein
VRLHNLEKIAIHLKEGCDAIIDTAKAIQTAHSEMFKPENFGELTPNPAIPATEKDLEYMLSTFNSLGRRVRSIETRVKNVINLVRISSSVSKVVNLIYPGIQSGDPKR